MISDVGWADSMTPFMEDHRTYRPSVFVTADGKCVYDSPATHVSKHAAYWVGQAVGMIDTQGRIINGVRVPRKHRPFITTEVEFPRDIGETNVVPTGQNDKIFYARRPGRNKLSRFVLDREPEPTRHFTVFLVERVPDYPGTYWLRTGIIGRREIPEPADYGTLYGKGRSKDDRRRMRERSLVFWSTHAFVARTVRFMPETLSNRQPADWFAPPPPPPLWWRNMRAK